MRSKRRLLESFSRIGDENLRNLVAELVQIRVEHESSKQAPLRQYRDKVDTYASEYGSRLDTEFQEQANLGPPDGDAGSEGAIADPSMVTLDRLVLRNFGSYFGEHTIDLAPQGTKNVTAVVGSNGDGKSTLFYALNWALYGEDFALELRRDKGRELAELVNRRLLLEAAGTGGEASCQVTLYFSANGRDYCVTRTLVVIPQKSDGRTTARLQSEDLRLRRIDANGNHEELLPSALPSVISSLPSHVKEFYLFDGERINRFVTPGSQALIRRAIRRVMGIEALEDTANDLAKVAKSFRTSARRESSGDLAEVQRKLEERTDSLGKKREERDEAKDTEIQLTARIDQIDDLLKRSPDTRPLQRRRDELRTSIENDIQEEQRKAYELRDLAANASLLLAGDAVTRLVSELDQRRKAGSIPGPISKQLIKDLLELEQCICGTRLEPGSEARAHLNDELKKLDARAETSETLLELFISLSSVSGALITDARSLDKRRRELVQIQRRIARAKEEQKKISEQIEGMEDVDRSGWETERRKKDTERVSVKASIMNLERDTTSLANEIRTLKSKEQELSKSEVRSRALVDKANWAEAAESALRLVFEDFAALARRDVEAVTARLWKTMLENVTPYRVEVSDDFELRVLSAAGDSAIQQLAMGQQQCLGLAFITAVAQVAEAKPPLVIDMPFGRLGADVASSVAATLPDLTNQLILFVLPETEWNEQTRTAIEPFLAREYHIRYDVNELSTRFIDPSSLGGA